MKELQKDVGSRYLINKTVLNFLICVTKREPASENRCSQYENIPYLCKVKRILSKRTIKEFWIKYPDSKDYLETWYETAKGAKWQNPNDIKSFYSTISILKDSRIVFNIKGNLYRLVAKINYKKQWLFIRFIGTHKDYDKIDANLI